MIGDVFPVRYTASRYKGRNATEDEQIERRLDLATRHLSSVDGYYSARLTSDGPRLVPRYVSWETEARDPDCFAFIVEYCKRKGVPVTARSIRVLRRAAMAVLREDSEFARDCEQCGERFHPVNDTARYCSNACRQRAYRKRARSA